MYESFIPLSRNIFRRANVLRPSPRLRGEGGRRPGEGPAQSQRADQPRDAGGVGCEGEGREGGVREQVFHSFIQSPFDSSR